MHVGCPPGLAIVFDAASTAASHQQHCQPTDNISCYYFNNGTRLELKSNLFPCSEVVYMAVRVLENVL